MVDHIKTICEEYHPSLIYHQTTINYIESLLSPFIESFNQCKNVDKWVEDNIPDELVSNDLIKTMNKPKLFDNRKEIRKNIIDSVLIKIINGSGINCIINRDLYVLPWDIQYQINSTCELSIIFKTDKLENKLPIIIGRSHHNLTLYSVAGILLFSLITDTKIDIVMFGASLSPDYLTSDKSRYSRFNYEPYRNDTDKYLLKIANKNFVFDNFDFMNGFISMCIKFNLNAKDYYDELLIRDNNLNKNLYL